MDSAECIELSLGQAPDRMLWNLLPRRIWAGIAALFSQGHILRNRTFSSLFHYGIAFGFIFYVIVNGVDVLEGYLRLTIIIGVLSTTIGGAIYIVFWRIS